MRFHCEHQGQYLPVVVGLQKRPGCKSSRKWRSAALCGQLRFSIRGFRAWLHGQLCKQERLTVDSLWEVCCFNKHISSLTQLKVISLPNQVQNG